MSPTSTQVKMLQSVCASLNVGTVEPVVWPVVSGKKFVSQFVCAVVCFVAEMMIHVAATANAAIVKRMWIVVYRRNKVAFSWRG